MLEPTDKKRVFDMSCLIIISDKYLHVQEQLKAKTLLTNIAVSPIF